MNLSFRDRAGDLDIPPATFTDNTGFRHRDFQRHIGFAGIALGKIAPDRLARIFCFIEDSHLYHLLHEASRDPCRRPGDRDP